jgi:hypothetical protein
MIFLTILFFINLLAGGCFVNKYFFKDSFFLSCALFLGAYVTLIFCILLLGLPLNILAVNFPLILIPFIFPNLRSRSFPPAVKIRFGKIDYVLCAVIAAVFILGVLHVMKAPIFERDGLGLWLTKAKAIVLDRTFLSDNFLDPWRIQDSPRYPLFLPLLEGSFMFQTAVNELTVKLIFIYFWFLILGAVFEGLLPGSVRAALLAVIVLAVIPAYYVMADGSLHTGYADVPISLFYLSAGILLMRYLRSGTRPPLIAAGLCVAFAAFTKNEGWAFGLGMLLAMILARRKIGDIALFLAVALGASIPWFLTLLRLPARYQENYLTRITEILPRLALIPRILKNALFEILNVRHWGVFWPAIAAVFIAVKPAPMIRRLLSAVAVTVACYLGAYLLTTWDVSFQMSVSFARLLLHVTPLLVLLAARQLAGAEKPDAP